MDCFNGLMSKIIKKNNKKIVFLFISKYKKLRKTITTIFSNTI